MNRDIRLVQLAFVLWGLGEGLFFFIQPLYFEALGANEVQIGFSLSIITVVNTISFLPAGWLADRLPRKGLMLGGWVLGIVAMLWVAAARTWQGLIPGLMIYYLSGYCVPVVNAYVAQAAGGRDLERVYSAIFAAYPAGLVVSPALGGWLAQTVSMRVVYPVAAAIFALSTVVVALVSPQPASPPVDRARSWRVLGNRRLLGFLAIIWLMFLAMYLGYPLSTNFLVDVRGWDLVQVGSLGSFTGLGTVIFSLLLGRLNAGRRVRGLLVGQITVWVWALVLLLTGYFPIVAAAAVLWGAFSSCLPLVRGRVGALVGEESRGLVLGAVDTVCGLARATAPALAGWLYKVGPAYPLVGSLVLIPVMIGLVVVGLPRPGEGGGRQ